MLRRTTGAELGGLVGFLEFLAAVVRDLFTDGR